MIFGLLYFHILLFLFLLLDLALSSVYTIDV